MEISFHKKLHKQSENKKSLLCIGLDVDKEKLPPQFSKNLHGVFDFIKTIIDSTVDICLCYKLNMAFFEQFGSDGYKIMENVVEYIDGRCVTIADGKRGDIGNSSRMYAKSIFNQIGFDSATISPYMGKDSISPFIEDSRFGIFVLCLTSNPGSNDLQKKEFSNEHLYISVINMLKEFNNENIGIVVGATRSDYMQNIRYHCGNMNWLIPGIGSQGGDIDNSVKIGNKADALGIITISRDILYYNNSSEEDIYCRALYYHNKIKKIHG